MPISSGGVSANGSVVSAVKCIEREAPETQSSAAIAPQGVAGPSAAQPNSVAACRTALTISTRRKPQRRRIGVVSGLMPMLPTNSGVSASPARVASKPRPSWNISGARTAPR